MFKRLVRLKPSRGAYLDGFHFSLHSYTTDDDPGPELPEALPLNLLVVGAGAIGNGIIYLLARLPVRGCVSIVDKQAYAEENLGTCILIGPQDIGTSKALFAEAQLRSHSEVKGVIGELALVKEQFGKALPYPQVAVGGVDNIDARHDIQRLWPDIAIDGAISDFTCQVSRHPWGENIACLICLFQRPPGEAAERIASRATGLRLERTRDADDMITEADVREAPRDKQSWLRDLVGHKVCSVIQEGAAHLLSEEEQRQDFAPSAPFVACLSASMVVSEVVKAAAGWTSSLRPRFQFDVLHGPAQGRRQDCICVTRKRNIETLRTHRVSDTTLLM